MKRGPHILVIGESGNGKSTFAATVIQKRNPRPVLVQLFDPRDKGTPYRNRGGRITLEEYPFGVREQVWDGDKHIATIETWHERQGKGSRGVTMKGGEQLHTRLESYIQQGETFELYLERMANFVDEASDWYAFIFDSTTFAEMMIRSYLTGKMKVADNMMIWSQATDEMERYLFGMFPDLDITTIVLTHVITEKQMGKGKDAYTEPAYWAKLPGRLKNGIFSAFGENYRAITKIEKDESGESKLNFYLQTATDGKWKMSSQLKVENPLGPSPHWKDIYRAALRNRPEGEAE